MAVIGLAVGLLAAAAGTSESYASTKLAAQSRPRITVHPRRVHPGPNARRYCRSWLAKEYRVSGPVVVPQMRCRWE
jgi:hypothetical protein